MQTIEDTIELYFHDFFTSPMKVYYEEFPFIEKNNEIDPSPDKIVSIMDNYYEGLMIGIKEDDKTYRVDSPYLNIWNVAGLGKSEVKNCAFLTWLLDPDAEHYQKDAFLKIFLNAFDDLKPFARETSGVRVRKEQQNEDKSRRIDIYMEGQDFLVGIEAKIDAGEQERQLEDYEKYLKKKAKHLGIDSSRVKLVFLTLDRGGPESGTPDMHIIWRDLIPILTEFSKPDICPNPFITSLVRQYIAYINDLN